MHDYMKWYKMLWKRLKSAITGRTSRILKKIKDYNYYNYQCNRDIDILDNSMRYDVFFLELFGDFATVDCVACVNSG